MKLILEFNPTEAKNAITSGSLLNLLETAVNEETAVQKLGKKEEPKPKTNPEPEPAEEAEETKITEVEIRAKFVALSKKGKKAELKKLLTDFGVEKVSDLQPDQYQEAMSKLEAM